MLIVLPNHLRVSGVTTWAMRSVEALRAKGVDSGLLVHSCPGQSVPQFLDGLVSGEIECEHPIEQMSDRLDELAEKYGRTISAMYERTGQPVVVVPCLHGDSFGAVAALTRSMPGMVRPVAWIHADNRYDLTVATHYESVSYGFGCVSRELTEQTTARLPARSQEIFRVPNPVGVPGNHSRSTYNGDRPIRLVYTGRLDEHQKRVSALPWIAQTLADRGVEFELRIIGDGDSMDTLRAHTSSLTGVELLGAVDPDRVAKHLRWGDLWVLPSRFEGQSVAMLEAMACGCVPVVTKVRSGVNESIVDCKSGFVVEIDEDASGEQAGRAMGETIIRARQADLTAMSTRAIEHIESEHNPDQFAQRLVSIIEHACAQPARVWGAERPTRFTGSTPEDAAERMRGTLMELSGRRIAVYGAGKHTSDLASVIAETNARIVCVIDDEPTRWGDQIAGWAIVSLDEAGSFGIQDVVISSWMHEDRLAERTIKRLPGARVHRLYDGAPTRLSTPARA